jgi:hypothetical protein
VTNSIKVKNLVADGWCPACRKAKGYTYNIAHASDPDAVELPEMCSCDGTVPALPVSAPTIIVRGPVSEEALRAMVSKVVAEALADVKHVKEVPRD